MSFSILYHSYLTHMLTQHSRITFSAVAAFGVCGFFPSLVFFCFVFSKINCQFWEAHTTRFSSFFSCLLSLLLFFFLFRLSWMLINILECVKLRVSLRVDQLTAPTCCYVCGLSSGSCTSFANFFEYLIISQANSAYELCRLLSVEACETEVCTVIFCWVLFFLF